MKTLLIIAGIVALLILYKRSKALPPVINPTPATEITTTNGAVVISANGPLPDPLHGITFNHF